MASGRGALGRERGRAGDARVRAVGGDEVDERFRVLAGAATKSTQLV